MKHAGAVKQPKKRFCEYARKNSLGQMWGMDVWFMQSECKV